MAFGWHDRYRPQRNWGARITESAVHGLRLVTLENELIRLGVLAGKGTDIIEFNFKPHDLDFVWLTAGGVRDPNDFLSSNPDSIATFLDAYPGGWQEIFPAAGQPSNHLGARFGQHGEVCNPPWDVRIVEDTEDAVAVNFLVRTLKTPFLLEKTIRLVRGEPKISIAETVTNESDVELRAMWGHHITFGKPFLDPTCRIAVPDGVTVIPDPNDFTPTRRVKGDRRHTWPIAEAPDGSSSDLRALPEPGRAGEMSYLTDFSEGWFEVEHPGKQIAFRVDWDIETMPYLWFWQEFGQSPAAPWYGRHYNIGLEPSSSYPTTGIADSVENGSAMRLGPRETKSFWMTATVLAP
jgi:hypothetical protein